MWLRLQAVKIITEIMHSEGYDADINGTVFLRLIFIDWTQALAIENTV